METYELSVQEIVEIQKEIARHKKENPEKYTTLKQESRFQRKGLTESGREKRANIKRSAKQRFLKILGKL